MSAFPDLASPEFKRDPYPFYARLRAGSPVASHTYLGQRFWLLTRYADVAAALKDGRLRKNALKTLGPEGLRRQPWMPDFVQPLRTNMLDQDPPDHTRLRALVSKAFTPRLVEQLRSRIQSQADELAARIRARGRTELIGDFALPIPLNVIADMLGVPEGKRHQLRSWSDRMVSVTGGLVDALLAVPALWRLIRYAGGLVREARRSPAEDIISALARVEEQGDRLSEQELVAMILLLLTAGYETTVNLIGTGTLVLLQHPEQLERLRAEPELIQPAVEELLRFCSPVDLATARYSAEEVTYSGVTIPRGALVMLAIGSANRDEEQFQEPDRLDLGRDPNRHLAFGNGIHYCLGAPLARLEAQLAFTALFQGGTRFTLQQPAGSLRWRRSPLLRGLKALPLEVARA